MENNQAAKGNQLTEASKLQNTVGNILSDNSFELGTTWTASGASVSNATGTSYYCSKALKVVTTTAGGAKTTFTAEAGKTYTISAYVKTGSSAAYLTLGGVSSETLAANSGWTRLEVSYTNSSSSAQTVTAQVMNAAAGTTYMDCVQAEMAPTASRYNLIVNGDFRDTAAWSTSSGRTTDTSAAPQLSTNVYKLSGTYTSTNRISQTVNVSGSSGDTFVLAGWAKGNAAPLTQFEGNTYEEDLLTKLTTGSTAYNFAYGNFGLRSSINVGSTTLATYIYDTENRTNWLKKLAYGNSNSVQYTYDSLGRVTKETYEDGDTVTYAYDNDGALATVTDSATGRTTTYYYDFTDRLMKYVESGSGYSHSVGYTYDDLNNLTALKEFINGTTLSTSYAYDDDNRVTSVTSGSATKSYTYDGFGRVIQRVTKHGSSTIATDTISYHTVNGMATGQVASLANKAGTFTYTYDANGNIKTVKFGSYTTTYTYDSQNQLTREDNQGAGKTWVWTYDDAGNILSCKEHAYTTGTLGSVVSRSSS